MHITEENYTYGLVLCGGDIYKDTYLTIFESNMHKLCTFYYHWNPNVLKLIECQI